MAESGAAAPAEAMMRMQGDISKASAAGLLPPGRPKGWRRDGDRQGAGGKSLPAALRISASLQWRKAKRRQAWAMELVGWKGRQTVNAARSAAACRRVGRGSVGDGTCKDWYGYCTWYCTVAVPGYVLGFGP